jgi:flagellar motor switch protein FliG
MDNDGIHRSAVLLMSLGEDEAAEVFKYLGPREVQKIGKAMAALSQVPREEVDNVLGKFCDEAGSSSATSIRRSLQRFWCTWIRISRRKSLPISPSGCGPT